MTTTLPINLLGLSVSGDLGGLTIYTDRYGRKTAFHKHQEQDPPSAARVANRDRFRQAQAAWKALSQGEKQTLELACNRASLPMTGQNLFISAILLNAAEAYVTLARQVQLPLPALPTL